MTDVALKFRYAVPAAGTDVTLQFDPNAGARYLYTLIIPAGSTTTCLVIPYIQEVIGTLAIRDDRDSAAGILTHVPQYFINAPVVERRDRLASSLRFSARTTWNIGDITERGDIVSSTGHITTVSVGTGAVTERDDRVAGVFHVDPLFVATGAIKERRDQIFTVTKVTQVTRQTDGVVMSDAISVQRTLNLLESVVGTITQFAHLLRFAYGATSILSTDRIYAGFVALVTESVVATEAAVPVGLPVLDIIDRLIATGTAATTLEATLSLATALVASERVLTGYSVSLNDAIEATDAVHERVIAYTYAIEQILATTAPTYSLTLVHAGSEQIVATTQQSLSASLTALLREGAEVRTVIRIGEDVYVGWVVNSETGGISQYEGYAFNSMTRLGNHFYGAGGQGISLLEGETDNGEPILSKLTTGRLQLGALSNRKVTTGDVYLVGTASGDLYLRVTPYGRHNPDSDTHQYRVVGNVTNSTMKREIGRGLAGHTWSFELESIEGSRLDLDAIEIFPILLNRRV